MELFPTVHGIASRCYGYVFDDHVHQYGYRRYLIVDRKAYLIYKEGESEPFAVTSVKDHSETIVKHFLAKGENVRKDSMLLVETFDDVRKVIGLKHQANMHVDNDIPSPMMTNEQYDNL